MKRDQILKDLSLAGKPVMCLIPHSDARHLRCLTGDPVVTSKVKEDAPLDVAKMCAVLLRGLNSQDRREAMSMIPGFAKGDQLDIIPISSLMPNDAKIADLARTFNGMALMLLSMGTSSADSSIGTAVANAASMASGAPFASDPLVGERQNEVLLAKAILEAALLDDETAKQWFRDNKIAQALEQMAQNAAAGTSDAAIGEETAAEKFALLYDCLMHTEPLGGDAFSGGAVGDFLKDAWEQTKKGLSDAVINAVKPTSSVADDAKESAAPASSYTQQELSDAGNDVSSVTQGLSSGIAAAREALNEAKAKMSQGQQDIAAYREQLQDTAKQAAKLQWAEALLNAPDDVATILTATTPNMNDVNGFLQSMLSVLPAAKETGSLGTLKALFYALKSAASNGNSAAGTLYSLFSGDPDNAAQAIEQDAPGWYAKAKQQGDVARQVATVGNEADMVVQIDVPSDAVSEQDNVTLDEGAVLPDEQDGHEPDVA